MSDDGRIEIELVEHEPPRHRLRRGGRPHDEPVPSEPPPLAMPAAPEPTEPGDQAPPPDRRSTAAVAGAVGAGALLVGLLAGWAVGRSGGDDATSPADAAVATSAVPAGFADDPALVEPDAPVITTEPSPPTTRRPTTTTVPAVQVISPIPDVDPALIGLPYELVTGSVSGNLQFIDLASNTMTVVDVRLGVDLFFLGEDWVLIPGSGQHARLLRDGDPEPGIARLDMWSTLHAAGAPTLWQYGQILDRRQPVTMTEVDETGAPTGRQVEVPWYPLLVEADGTFLVQAPGGTYAVTETGVRQLTNGEVLAIGPTAALLEECDAELRCRYVGVDRISGDRTVLDVPELAAAAIAPAAWWNHSSPAVSPDGSLALMSLATSDGMTNAVAPVILDLHTGAVTRLDAALDPWMSGLAWADDSQYAFFMSRGELLAWSRATGEVLRAGPEERSTTRPQVFRIRPSDGVPWPER